MDREDRDGVRIRVELSGGRIIARFDKRRQVRRHEDSPVVAEQRRLRPDDLEEAGDVRELFLGRRRICRDQPGEQAAGAQEPVQELARGPLVRVVGVAAQVRHELVDRRSRLWPDAQDARLAIELIEHRPDRAIAASGHVDDGSQILATEPIDVRCGDRVEVNAGIEVGSDAEERQQQPHLRTGVQAGRPGEPPWDSDHVQRPQDRVSVSVRPHEDRVVASRGTRFDPAPDIRRDPVGLLGARAEDLEPDRRRGRRDTLGPQPLGDARLHLESIGIVEPDEPMGRVEDRRERAIVPSQHHGPCPEIPSPEGEDVVDCRAAERVDRLVVVADHRHVAMLVGQRRDELGLGAVGVLELVDQDVPEATGDLAPGGRRRAHEVER